VLFSGFWLFFTVFLLLASTDTTPRIVLI